MKIQTETKPQHTPGPWHIGQANWVVSGDKSIPIAKVGQAHAENGEQEANTRLIAAAPDLLAAAKRIIYPDGGRDYPDGQEALARAIAKAEGR